MPNFQPFYGFTDQQTMIFLIKKSLDILGMNNRFIVLKIHYPLTFTFYYIKKQFPIRFVTFP